MSNKQYALSYLSKGYSVIPMWSPDLVKRSPDRFVKLRDAALAKNQKEGSPLKDQEVTEKVLTTLCKMPSISAWKEYQQRLPTEAEVEKWFTDMPEANIAIVTGMVSNLVVFDLDSQDAIDYAESEGGFPDAPKAKTGKGYHIYSVHPGFEVKNSVNKRLDVDIRADGGLVVAPPSMHGSGSRYTWEDGLSIHQIDPAPCEPWMYDYLKGVAESNSKPVKEKKEQRKTADSVSGDSKQGSHTPYSDILQNGSREGERNVTAVKLIGHLFAKGLDSQEIWSIIESWNIKNSPPLDHAELFKTFESIRKKEAENQPTDKKEINVLDMLDTPEKVVAEYDDNYIRVPFADRLLPQLESKMNGGLAGGRLYVLGGIPSSGKTVLTNNIADNLCRTDWPVLFFSYDDGRAELRYRTYARFSGFDIEEFNQRTVGKADMEAICKTDRMRLINKNKYVVQRMLKIESWPSLVDEIIARHQKPPVIIVDYLRKIKSKNNRSDERLRVDEILSNLTDLAKRYNLPVLVISELARDSYKSGQRLSMASFKESGSIEYEASWLGILAAVEEAGFGYTLKTDWEKIINHDGNIDLIVFKAKRGTGMTGKIPLKLNKANMSVRDRIETSHIDSVQQMKKVSNFD